MRRNIHLLGAGFVASVLGVSMLGTAASANCATRNFYNNSQQNFTVVLSVGKCSLPNSPNVAACDIPPGQVAELHYANYPIRYDQLTIYSQDNKLYPPTQFSVAITAGGCYVNHHGNTGNIAVNSDADGDVATCGPNHAGSGSNGGWSCN